jgi:hypothetical protein
MRHSATTSVVAAVLAIAPTFHAPIEQPPPSVRSAPFRFQTDEFWLNLHHFLYVLGRSVAKIGDTSREAVAHAPEESTRGLATLDEADKKAWMTGMAFYAAGPSRKDAVFDAPLPSIAHALADAGDSATLANAPIEPALRSILEAAAPAYRKAWWPAHHAANLARRDEIQALLNRHGAAILGFVEKAYQMTWLPDGYPVHVSGYANWAGAYSTIGNLLMVSSLDSQLREFHGLETVFHEGMHQWDFAVNDLLSAQARRAGKRLPPNVSHALIFYTAGEAVRRVNPDHVPYADANGVWQRGYQRFKAPLDEVWKPHLNGSGTRDEAFAALIAKIGL